MSEIRANTVSNAAGTGPVTLTGQAAMRHYLNMNADSGTPVVQDSLNNSSITDVAAGQYTVNFTNAFAAATYSTAAGLSGDPAVYCGPIQVHTALTPSVAVSYSVNGFGLMTPNSGFSIIDFAYVGTQTAGALA